MTTNADMTVYHRSVDPETRQDIYARYLVYGVLWEERKAANVAWRTLTRSRFMYLLTRWKEFLSTGAT